MEVGLIVVLVVVAAVGLALLGIYNGMVAKRNRIQEAFSTIDVMLKKRYDLIPNMVATVKQYTTHESETLTKIAGLRARAMDPNLPMDERVKVDNELMKGMRGLMVQVEAYPDLKTNENFMHLQRTLNEVEEQLSAARRAFNAAVLEMNNAVEMFPSNIVAGMFNFKRHEMFEVPEGERATPNVKSLFA